MDLAQGIQRLRQVWFEGQGGPETVGGPAKIAAPVRQIAERHPSLHMTGNELQQLLESGNRLAVASGTNVVGHHAPTLLGIGFDGRRTAFFELCSVPRESGLQLALEPGEKLTARSRHFGADFPETLQKHLADLQTHIPKSDAHLVENVGGTEFPQGLDRFPPDSDIGVFHASADRSYDRGGHPGLVDAGDDVQNGDGDLRFGVVEIGFDDRERFRLSAPAERFDDLSENPGRFFREKKFDEGHEAVAAHRRFQRGDSLESDSRLLVIQQGKHAFPQCFENRGLGTGGHLPDRDEGVSTYIRVSVSERRQNMLLETPEPDLTDGVDGRDALSLVLVGKHFLERGGNLEIPVLPDGLDGVRAHTLVRIVEIRLKNGYDGRSLQRLERLDGIRPDAGIFVLEKPDDDRLHRVVHSRNDCGKNRRTDAWIRLLHEKLAHQRHADGRAESAKGPDGA
ncbi:MAG: hypothetical protein BWY66_00117 [bacterium ADurb.Bin374]|nr:MAG: hypothetical protein BWY66_00117 [bacterium ADurb.Bin374]